MDNLFFALKCFAVFIRISAILFALPFFGEKVVPVQIRLLASVALTLGSIHLIPETYLAKENIDLLGFLFICLKEVFLGLAIGFIAKVMFEGLILAASLVGYQMGFSAANLILPDYDAQTNAFVALHRTLVLLCFLSLNLHFIFINGIVETFSFQPESFSFVQRNIFDIFVLVTQKIFLISIKLASPVLVSLLFSMAIMGLIAKVVPQVNIFTLSFPASFFVGLFAYLSTALFLPDWLQNFYKQEAIFFLNSVKILVGA